MVVAMGAPAMASGPAPGPNSSYPSTTTIGSPPAGGSGGVHANLVMGGTSGCYGQTDSPHASGHVYGTVNVVARTVCPTTDYVSTELYRSRWWGWESLGSGANTRYGTATTNAAGPCATGDIYTYLGDSYHEGSGAGYAYTSNQNRFTCP